MNSKGSRYEIHIINITITIIRIIDIVIYLNNKYIRRNEDAD